MRRCWLQKQSAQALLWGLVSPRVYRPGSLERLSCIGRPNAFGETPERRLWAYKREARRAVFARRSALTGVRGDPAQTREPGDRTRGQTERFPVYHRAPPSL